MASLIPAEILNEPAARMAVLGAATFVAFYTGRWARRFKVPSIIGYMVVGVIIGPSLLNLFPMIKDHEGGLEALSFITNVALGFVAVSIGAELSLKSLKKLGSGIIGIILGSSFLAFFLVMAGVLIYSRLAGDNGWDWPLALVFAAMAPATAPAGTVAVIHEYKAKGKLTQALYAVVGFDDGLAIVIFAFAAGAAKIFLVQEIGGDDVSLLSSLGPPFIELFGSLVLGTVLGFFFGVVMRRLKNVPETLVVVFSFVLIATGLSMLLHLSLILTNMCIGFVLINTRAEPLVKRATEPLRTIMPLIFVMFFCLAGAHLDLGKLLSLGVLGLIYIVCRSVGKVYGAVLGAKFGEVAPEVKKYTGWGILSQAGVAIGLSLVVREDFAEIALNRNYPRAGDIGTNLVIAITASCIVFEVIGPILAKVVLEKAGEIPKKPKPPPTPATKD